jgi:copper homeostasis protein (lipoprotein)
LTRILRFWVSWCLVISSAVAAAAASAATVSSSPTHRVAPRYGKDQRSPASGIGNLPATFVGLVPCSDCVGTRYRIDLLPGNAYIQRVTYLRETNDASYYEIGAWSLSGDRRLTLEPGRGSKSYWGVGAGTLHQLGARGEPIDSRPAYELTRISDPDPMVPRVELSGMFRYMADASRFRDCRSGLEWPVSMSDDYQALERAHTSRRSSPGSELLVSLRGRIEDLPRMEGRGTEPTLVVEKFLRAKPGERCDGQTPSSELENNRWVPLEIGGEELRSVSGDQREPWIELEPKAMRVTGSGGCNRISGGYTAGDGTLRFGALITTRMACVDMKTETAFLRALEATRRYRVRGREVELYDGKGSVVARLEERNLR